jgi:hypothetical protein
VNLPVVRNPNLTVHNLNVRVPRVDLLDFQECSAFAGMSLNKWVLRACRQKADLETALRAAEERDGQQEASGFQGGAGEDR